MDLRTGAAGGQRHVAVLEGINIPTHTRQAAPALASEPARMGGRPGSSCRGTSWRAKRISRPPTDLPWAQQGEGRGAPFWQRHRPLGAGTLPPWTSCCRWRAQWPRELPSLRHAAPPGMFLAPFDCTSGRPIPCNPYPRAGTWRGAASRASPHPPASCCRVCAGLPATLGGERARARPGRRPRGSGPRSTAPRRSSQALRP
mmetsp:Transcript_43711/g.121497  ORF Transcript_43711/g.121497 Transcript_43711/m.121497 type:complete len:201 (-) Transcript_43711:527-1129(-)